MAPLCALIRKAADREKEGGDVKEQKRRGERVGSKRGILGREAMKREGEEEREKREGRKGGKRRTSHKASAS